MLEVLIFFILAVVIGLLFAFFGYAFFRVLLPIWGFFAGLSLGFQGMESLMGDGFFSSAVALTVGVVIGLAFAMTAFWFYELAVYLFGMFTGYVLGYGFAVALNIGDSFIPALFGIVGAVLLTILFVKTSFPKAWIMLITAGAGAMAVITGVFVLFGAAPVEESLQITKYMVNQSFFWTVAWLVLATFAFVFQFALTKGAEDLSKSYDWEALEKEMAKAKESAVKS